MIESMKDTALVNPNDIAGLIGYYREKVSHFEDERNKTIIELEKLKVPQKEKHELEWENYRLKNSIEELNKTLREIKIKFFEERTLIIQLKNENSFLKEDLDKEKSKIKELLAHNNVVEEQLILKEEKKPKFHHKFIRNPSNKEADKFKKPNPTGKLKTSSYATKSDVVINNENKQQHKASNTQNPLDLFEPTTNQKLEMLEEERAILLQQVKDLENENKRLEEKLQNDVDIKNKEIERLMADNQKVERINVEINKEMFKQRNEFSNKENGLNEEIELLKIKLVDMSNVLADCEQQTKNEKLYSIKLAESKSKECLDTYKRQIVEKEQSINIVRKQYDQVQKIFKERLEVLNEENKQLKNKLEKLNKVKKLHLEGADNENKYLKERIDELEQALSLERQYNTINPESLPFKIPKDVETKKTKRRDRRSNSKKSNQTNPIENLRKTIEEISKKYDNS